MRSPHTATKSSHRSLQLEKACAQQPRPNAAKNKYINKYIYIYKKNSTGKVVREIQMRKSRPIGSSALSPTQAPRGTYQPAPSHSLLPSGPGGCRGSSTLRSVGAADLYCEGGVHVPPTHTNKSHPLYRVSSKLEARRI